ncbi:GNAT family N-acetyltransferase [Bosea lathyri]|uniref:Acetyltransferase (GNAT) domain-containing protein n=1 Tax=Bosea lathyri TaxID=1036778 RepID=A0A1H6D5Q4_9HYPH|nr:GNAT family N-acetyltransferase [Bosea lathyri]SEG80318.1 Acetyltransferase (GNAT) domain-containing protein [Bosea lathyri]
MSEFEIRPIEFDEKAIGEYCELFSKCFPGSANYSRKYLEWLYCENPLGRAVGFDAWAGSDLAAHYVCVPVSYRYGGKVVRGLLSLNTATGEAYRGKGLFTKLAEATYARGTDLGMDFVIGVANANSTPGFVKRLGFELISPLDAKIGIGLGVEQTQEASFQSVWDRDTIEWRLRSPRNAVHLVSRGDRSRFWAYAGRKSVIAVAERQSVSGGDGAGSFPFARPQVFIGLLPAAANLRGIAIDVPGRFRTSPLNLIFRPLAIGSASPKKSEILFDFLDFDAF